MSHTRNPRTSPYKRNLLPSISPYTPNWRDRYPEPKAKRPNCKHEIICWPRCPPLDSYSRPLSLEFLSEYQARNNNTGLNEARKKAGIATPHIFIRRKCQSRALCSRSVSDSWTKLTLNSRALASLGVLGAPSSHTSKSCELSFCRRFPMDDIESCSSSGIK